MHISPITAWTSSKKLPDESNIFGSIASTIRRHHDVCKSLDGMRAQFVRVPCGDAAVGIQYLDAPRGQWERCQMFFTIIHNHIS